MRGTHHYVMLVLWQLTLSCLSGVLAAVFFHGSDPQSYFVSRPPPSWALLGDGRFPFRLGLRVAVASAAIMMALDLLLLTPVFVLARLLREEC